MEKSDQLKIQELERKILDSDIPQAFSHFTYNYS